MVEEARGHTPEARRTSLACIGLWRIAVDQDATTAAVAPMRRSVSDPQEVMDYVE